MTPTNTYPKLFQKLTAFTSTVYPPEFDLDVAQRIHRIVQATASAILQRAPDADYHPALIEWAGTLLLTGRDVFAGSPSGGYPPWRSASELISLAQGLFKLDAPPQPLPLRPDLALLHLAVYCGARTRTYCNHSSVSTALMSVFATEDEAADYIRTELESCLSL